MVDTRRLLKRETHALLDSRGPLHGNDKGLVLRAPAMHHEGLRCRTGAVVAGEMGDVRRDDAALASFDRRRSLSFDFHDQSPFERVENFLRARVHVPRSGDAGPELDHTHNALLNLLTL